MSESDRQELDRLRLESIARDVVDLKRSFAKADDERRPTTKEIRDALQSVIDDADESPENRKKAKRALALLDDDEKKSEARAVEARLSNEERELLAGSDPNRARASDVRAVQRGSDFQCGVYSKEAARARLEELEAARGRR